MCWLCLWTSWKERRHIRKYSSSLFLTVPPAYRSIFFFTRRHCDWSRRSNWLAQKSQSMWLSSMVWPLRRLDTVYSRPSIIPVTRYALCDLLRAFGLSVRDLSDAYRSDLLHESSALPGRSNWLSCWSMGSSCCISAGGMALTLICAVIDFFRSYNATNGLTTSIALNLSRPATFIEAIFADSNDYGLGLFDLVGFW